MADPWWLVPGRTSSELRVIFIGQCLNVYAMFLVKASICAYLMALDFGRSYRFVIWTSVVVVVLCNFVMMLILQFAFCRPYVSAEKRGVRTGNILTFAFAASQYSRWDNTVQGVCWLAVVGEAMAYAQIGSNIFTDLVSIKTRKPSLLSSLHQIYVAAPIVYLRNVQLSKPTQWGVRCVFLMALV